LIGRGGWAGEDGFRIPTILEIWDEDHVEEDIYLMDSSDRIYMVRVRWRYVILKAAGKH